MHTSSLVLALAPAAALAQAPMYAQCKLASPYYQLIKTKIADTPIRTGGGQGWTGATTCVSGAVCQKSK